ncbi:MAG: type II toxin-antitoxin system RelE/ParE family toxin [Candidatus Acidiferrum sp.]
MKEWEAEFTDEFGAWWSGLTEGEQIDVRAGVNLLRRFGPALGRPPVDSVAPSKHANMKELRIQHRGQPYRVLFAFDPRRAAILLIGGNKTGKGRWYKEFVPIADRLYDEHLEALRKEGLLDG